MVWLLFAFVVLHYLPQEDDRVWLIYALELEREQ
jgi:hypothetical protein